MTSKFLKIAGKTGSSAPRSINYAFKDVLAALGLLDKGTRTWILDDALFTWPEDMLDENMEVADPHCRVSRNGSFVVCDQEVMNKLVESLFGDWTDIYVISASLDSVRDDDVQELTKTYEYHFECVDAAFWIIESEKPDLESLLTREGFQVEHLRKKYW